MKQTLIRLLLIAAIFMAFYFVANFNEVGAALWAFIIAYILEPVIVEKL